MNTTLIIGAGPGSIGAFLARTLGNAVAISRSSRPSIDVTKPREVLSLMQSLSPDTVILTAGTDPPPRPIGHITDWEEIGALLAAKSLGALAVLDAAARIGVRCVIFVGGSALSADSGFAHFTIGNGALWNAVRFAAAHTGLSAYYLELGLVLPSPMAERHLGRLDPAERAALVARATPLEAVGRAVKDIMDGRHAPGSRVVANAGDL